VAQIIRHRRGTVAELSGITLSNGEIGVTTGSVSVGSVPVKGTLHIGHTDGTNRLVGALVKGTSAPNLSGETGGANFNNMLFYLQGSHTLYRLHATDGNENLDLTGNIKDRHISGSLLIGNSGQNEFVQITGSLKVTGSAAGYDVVDFGSMANVTASALRVTGNTDMVGNLSIGGNITIGDETTDTMAISADLTSNIIPNASDSYNLGSDSQRWNDLYLSGSISASGGPIDIDSITTIALDSTTTTTVHAVTSLSAIGSGSAQFGDDVGTWEFNGSGAVSETGMTTFSLTPSSTVDIDAGGALTIDATAISLGTDSDVAFDIDTSTLDIDSSGAITIDGTSTVAIAGASTSTYGDDTAVWSFNGSGAVSETGMTTFSLTPSSTVDIDAAGAVTIDGTSVTIAGDDSGVAVSIGHATSETTVNDNLNVTGNTIVSGELSSGNITVTGSLVATGNVTAQTFTVSSSVTYLTQSFSSGSTIFGDTADDLHEFTGSLSITGSLAAYSTGSAVEATGSTGNGSFVTFKNQSDHEFGYLTSSITSTVTSGLVGYSTNGTLTVSSVIDGGGF